MNFQLNWHSHAWDLATAGAIFGGFLLAALVVRLIGTRLLAPLLRYAGLEPGHSMFTPLRDLIFWGILVSGLYEALSSFHGLATQPHLVVILDRAHAVLWGLLVISTLFQVFNRSITWYLAGAAKRADNKREANYQAALLRRIVNVVVVLLGLLYILRAAGIDTTPLLASSAISGVAVAFAAQDTIANLFAGFYLTLDKPIRVGDFMRLESGQEGTVEEIGWRNTRIRLLANTTVMIPNSKLSQSVFTNYDLPQSEMNLVVPSTNLIYSAPLIVRNEETR